MRSPFVVLGVVVSLLVPLRARADSSDAARAQELFDQAVTASRALDYATACPKFAGSQRLDPKTSTLLNLATCYELNGQTASAWATFKEARAAAVRFNRTEWADRASAAIAALEPRLVRLTVHVPPELRESHASVTLDGSLLASTEWESALPIDPGKHEVGWAASGYESKTVEVVLKSESVTLTLAPLARVAPPHSAAGATDRAVVPAPFWTTGRVGGVVIGSVGLATVAAGTVFGLLSSAKYDEAERLCGAPGGSPRTCASETSGPAIAARSDASDLAAASTVLFVAGGALVAAGAVWFLSSPAKSSVAIAPHPLARGLALSGRW